VAGIVNLRAEELVLDAVTDGSGHLLRVSDFLPDRKSLVSISAEVGGGLLMALEVEEVGDGFMSGKKLLGLFG